MSVRCNACGTEWPRDPALEVACPRCLAPIGAKCRRPSGHDAPAVHTERDALALAEGKLQPCPARPQLPGIEPKGGEQLDLDV